MLSRTWRISDLISQLEPDPWRAVNPFSDDIEKCHTVLFDPATSREEKAQAIDDWLAVSQPCRFGQMEANQRRLSYCLLTENDLERSDQDIRATIHRERMDWKQRARQGASHGFLIVAISAAIAHARQGTTLQSLAERLCDLYLGAADPDKVHLDDLILEMPVEGGDIERRRWNVGVNYFSSQGDGRWWRDHRFPGGMAYSMNSVGHFARALVEKELRKNPNVASGRDVPRHKLVYWALPMAMKTIGPPVEGSGRGTWLADRGKFPEDTEPPTYEQRRRHFDDLAAFSENRYVGRYHTDWTIPSDYFRDGLWKLEEIGSRDDLFFTYLHRMSDSDYADYESMGIGKLLGMNEVE